MTKRVLFFAAVAATSVLVAPVAASASSNISAGSNISVASNISAGSNISAASAASSRPVTFRKGLTLNLPSSWTVYGKGTDWVHVVTGSCTRPTGGYNSACDQFWILGPKAIELGHEVFNPYTPDQPYYPATDVQPCPLNRRWGQAPGPLADDGLRQVGPGHKAYYRDWNFGCVSYSSGKKKASYHQREWFLPKSKILVVDQWSTPGLAKVLKNATWQ